MPPREPQYRCGVVTRELLRDARAVVIQVGDAALRVPVERHDTPRTFVARLVDLWNNTQARPRRPKLMQTRNCFYLVRRDKRPIRWILVRATKERSCAAW